MQGENDIRPESLEFSVGNNSRRPLPRFLGGLEEKHYISPGRGGPVQTGRHSGHYRHVAVVAAFMGNPADR